MDDNLLRDVDVCAYILAIGMALLVLAPFAFVALLAWRAQC